MDSELLIALLVLWTSTTIALVAFLRMWFSNKGESFHPHSVDIEHRHNFFLVVNSKTFCKYDCPVKSISLFVAPRGSSSSKYFTVLSCIISISGLFGTARWYYVNDASLFEAILSLVGFASLLLVTTFELDVVPERFLEDKLLVTGWLIEKLNMQKELNFDINTYNDDFLNFLRQSNEIYYLYDEDIYLKKRTKKFNIWKYHTIWPTLHMVGCCAYIILVPAAIILNDIAEEKVAWITGILFTLFCFMAYLTGNYVPVIKYFRCWILLWNPFLNEPHFMLKLKKAIEEYNRKLKEKENCITLTDSKSATILNQKGSELVNRKNKNKLNKPDELSDVCDDTIYRTDSSHSLTSLSPLSCQYTVSDSFNQFKESYYRNSKSPIAKFSSPSDSNFLKESLEIDRLYINDNIFLKYARYHPREYLTIVGHLFVMTELIAIMTPSVAMGIQWITALCDGPPLLSIIEMFEILLTCLFSGDCSLNNEKFHHCILKSHTVH